jgi:hypothetical protein
LIDRRKKEKEANITHLEKSETKQSQSGHIVAADNNVVTLSRER